MTGTELKKLRKEKGLTQSEFASYVGVNVRTLQLWEYKGSDELSRTATDTLNVHLKGLSKTSDNRIPFFNINDFAGEVVTFNDNMPRVKYYIDFPEFNDYCNACIQVIGNDMHPIYRNGDYIGLAEAPTTHWCYGKTHFIITREAHKMLRIIKKHPDNKYLLMTSSNSEFEDFKILKSDIARLFLVTAEFKKNAYA